jgi:dTDP-4-dehydrorhamnose reductase
VKVIILGADGMLGHKIFSFFCDKGLNAIGTIKEINANNELFITKYKKNIKNGFNADNIEDFKKLFCLEKPDYILNCIGIIKQLKISNDPIISISLNSLFPHKIAEICIKLGIKLIHFSTDCVFSGDKGNYSEENSPDANDLYGKSKLLGEIDYGNCLTLRTSIIGHELGTKNGLIEWFLSQENEINGYMNSIFTGFPTVEIANILYEKVIKSDLIGVYHLSSVPISKYQLLNIVKEVYGKKINIIPFNNKKENRSLNSEKFRIATGYQPPEWIDLINKMYEDYKNSEYYHRGNS